MDESVSGTHGRFSRDNSVSMLSEPQTDSSPETVDARTGAPQKTFTLAARPREMTPLDAATVRLSVLIPVYNERHTIETILDRVHATPLRTEIICVDDGSTDGTRERLLALHEDR